jgi:tellurite methyltransferase
MNSAARTAPPADPSESVDFFARQFDRQIVGGDYALNPFETLALPHLKGRVLDLGCGLGNLSVAAAEAGASVVALDACANAVADLNRRARELGLDIEAAQADLRHWQPVEVFDSVACIGLLMFFDRAEALAGLRAVRDSVKPGGVAAVNVLEEGTTFVDFFAKDAHHLFTRDELLAPFDGWARLELRQHEFAATERTVKRFLTLIVRRPA